ncbi:MAG TPA: TrbI/VirB10 family protein [Mycobacterium sp.]|jgi:type IV secretion system protein VirB10|nr:TrbI/VirB10 family protein [Mycobacterium sp.]
MAEQLETSGTAPVVDRRPVPRGVLPKGVQTWLMVALAIGMLGIIFLTGQPDGPAAPRQATQPAAAPSADRVRDYQERLRLLDEQAARELRQAALDAQSVPMPTAPEDVGPPPVDPLVAERQRRDYESLFASNVVLSRRPDGQRPDAGQRVMPGNGEPRLAAQEPSIDEIADAVVRATGRTAGAVAPVAGPPVALGSITTANAQGDQPSPQPTPRISAVGPLHRVLEGTVIDAVLTNRLDGAAAAPVNCLVTNPVYSHSGQHVLIPAGARVLGETRPVQTLGQTRLAVAFHRLLMPDGSTVPLDQFKGLNQIGDSGLRDRVNHHFMSTFGAAAAIGLVSGLSQWLGNAAFGIGDGDRTVVIAGSAADATAQASAQVMSRFLNRLPTITIREGHRVKVYITSDLDLPEWRSVSQVGRLQRR